MGASEKGEEEAIRKAVDFSTAQPISFFLFNQYSGRLRPCATATTQIVSAQMK